MDEKEPSLKFRLVDNADMKRHGLLLDVPEVQTQKETRHKNRGRTVVQAANRETSHDNQEVREMETTQKEGTTHEHVGIASAPTGDGPVDTVVHAVNHQSDEIRKLRLEVVKQTSLVSTLKAAGIGIGVVAAGTVLGYFIVGAVMNRGEPELPSSPMKK